MQDYKKSHLNKTFISTIMKLCIKMTKYIFLSLKTAINCFENRIMEFMNLYQIF